MLRKGGITIKGAITTEKIDLVEFELLSDWRLRNRSETRTVENFSNY